jgi:hypothetical protein
MTAYCISSNDKQDYSCKGKIHLQQGFSISALAILGAWYLIVGNILLLHIV